PVEEPASAAENCWPTLVPMPWNSGIAAYCTPTYGTGCTVGLFGSAASIDASVSLANGATFRYSGFWYSEVRVPGGTFAHPSFEATSLVYSLLVAQAMNFSAAATFFEPAGIARFHAHRQF